jgi:hypothetical protein
MAVLPTTLTDREDRPFTVRAYHADDRAELEAMYDAFEPKRGAQGLPPESPRIAAWLDRVLAEGCPHGGRGRAPHRRARHAHPDGRRPRRARQLPAPGRAQPRHRDAAQPRRARRRRRARLEPRVALRRAVQPRGRPVLREGRVPRLPGSLWAPELEMQADTATAPLAD